MKNYLGSNLLGKTFGRLLVIDKKIKNNRNYWKCKCSCGKFTIVRQDSLIRKVTISCGCFLKENNKKLNTKHGFYNTKFYKTWQGLKDRCNNENNQGYKNYGGRGITYDPRWNEFENFYIDMYFKYLYTIRQLKIKQPSIERIDVNGNYCFDNCCFIEKANQAKNRRNTKK
jgi:hypothetical protein